MKFIVISVIAAFIAGCGVKGDPVPPETPAEIGSGRPTFAQPPESKPSAIIPPSHDQSEPTSEENQEE